MTVWHWVRHGPTHAKDFVGWRDLPADLSNAAQIASLKAHLPAEAVMISSDLTRARATADAVQGPGHRRLPHAPGLREFHLGLWDGMHFSQVSARDPDLSRAYWETPGTVQAPSGESWDMAAARINAVVNHLNARHPKAHVIAVAHIGVILTQIARATGISPYEALSHTIDNLSVTRITWTGGKGAVGRINHLP